MPRSVRLAKDSDGKYVNRILRDKAKLARIFEIISLILLISY